MKLYFEQNVSTAIKSNVTKLIENNNESNGNITLEYIPEEELECYEEYEDFIQKHLDCEFYIIIQAVSGTWGQPICLVAVE